MYSIRRFYLHQHICLLNTFCWNPGLVSNHHSPEIRCKLHSIYLHDKNYLEIQIECTKKSAPNFTVYIVSKQRHFVFWYISGITSFGFNLNHFCWYAFCPRMTYLDCCLTSFFNIQIQLYLYCQNFKSTAKISNFPKTSHIFRQLCTF